ncbi:MAG: hypothetical protein HYY02_10080 [Chloroflexi bacterium]|nr:hypothetical protein [Chloroflexota bacterium]
MLRNLNIALLAFFVLGGLYYRLVDKGAEGALVVLIGILWFVALPHVRSTS